jgi:hypothetical protein
MNFEDFFFFKNVFILCEMDMDAQFIYDVESRCIQHIFMFSLYIHKLSWRKSLKRIQEENMGDWFVLVWLDLEEHHEGKMFT